MKQPVIKTEKFILRPFKMADAPDVAKQVNDKEIIKYVESLPYPYRLEDAKYWLKKVTAEKYKKEPGQVDFAIEIDGKAAGSISLNNVKYGHKAEIGYWLGKNFHGSGVMSKAIEQVCKFGFRELGLKRIFAVVHIDNKPSKKVLEKNGFQIEGIMKKASKRGSRCIDSYLLAKVK
jgi:RimJ/RimL family protein N-acetyltransferase